MIFLGLGGVLTLFERWQWEKLSLELIILIMVYLVMEIGIKIGQGYGSGRVRMYVEPKEASFLNRLNLILREIGIVMVTAILILGWLKTYLW